LSRFSGIGLFVFSDPGAAKAVLAQAICVKENLSTIFIISDRQYNFYKDFDLDVIIADESPDVMIDKIKPDFIFTGTSYTSKIELEYLQIAKHKGIFTMAFVDHWSSIKERFEYGDLHIYPNEIFVIDEEAKIIALSDGIPHDILKIYNNPYYQFIKDWKPNISKESLFQELGIINHNHKLLVFAPEPLSNINGIERFGFDECVIMDRINQILESNQYDFSFVLKTHPNQDVKRIESVIGKKIIIVDDEIDSKLLMYYGDLILGFFSNFLIEASHMEKKILRLDFHSMKEDPLANSNIGTKVNEQEFITELNKLHDFR
jgi:hypothetical protein